MSDEYMTVSEVAKFMRVSNSTVYRWTTEGILQKYKIGRRNLYRKSEVEAAIGDGREG